MNTGNQDSLSEEELDVLVSIAIRRAEMLDEQSSPVAREAWGEVMAYEERIASITAAEDVFGGVARVGAIRAALAAGQRQAALQLQGKYLGEQALPAERRAAIERAVSEDHARRALRYPSLAKKGSLARLVELDTWRGRVASMPHVFPCAA